MAGCQPGCTCGRHGGKTFVSREASRAAYYQENRERLIAGISAYNQRPEIKAARKVRSSRWQQKYRDTHREEIRAKRLAAYDPAASSAKSRMWKFGLSPEDTLRRFNEQRGRCYIGGELLDLDAPRGYHVDHARWHCPGNKSCGKCVRGLTCHKCNTGAGFFGDDPAALRRAADSIESADSAVAERIAIGPVQEELPINVRRLERREESA
jgi:hypothetical protein